MLVLVFVYLLEVLFRSSYTNGLENTLFSSVDYSRMVSLAGGDFIITRNLAIAKFNPHMESYDVKT